MELTWKHIRHVWGAGQKNLPEVVRWKKYRNVDPGVERQDSLMHSYSITLLGSMFVEMLRPYVDLDEALLVNALLIHDHGEGELQKDTHYIDKTSQGDVEEYHAFFERFKNLPPELLAKYQEAFLLQFALKEDERFPLDARVVMRELAVTRRNEALAFDAVERWDYVLYAIEQFEARGNKEILTQVLRHQVPHLRRLADELPGFRETVWVQAIDRDAEAFLRDREGKLVEKPGI